MKELVSKSVSPVNQLGSMFFGKNQSISQLDNYEISQLVHESVSQSATLSIS